MNIIALLRERFAAALASVVEAPDEYTRLVQPAQNAQFGDYQANCAMPLAKVLGQPPRKIAEDLVARLQLDDLCETPEIAGPGFINLRLKTDWLARQLETAHGDRRLGIPPVSIPKKIVIDFSSPNVAKPMHVGHLRSTVIGDALYRLFQFLGHDIVGDNHIGDWGTQFGMILYGYKHFLDAAAYAENPVGELSRLYRLINQLCDYHDQLEALPGLKWKLGEAEQAVNDAEAEIEQIDKESRATLKKRQAEMSQLRSAVAERKIAEFEANSSLKSLADAHPHISTETRLEVAKLHAGDAENRRLWEEFLPACNAAMETVYQRLNVKFDLTLGESFYQPLLAGVVSDLRERELARPSQGAMCVFIPGNRAPFIVQKSDGAFNYATTDLATIQYRVAELKADTILYVVDKRQSEHFDLLFQTARLWGYRDLTLVHISFGTVMGSDNKPYKTRSGDVVGLGSLLDEAIERARKVVDTNDDSKPNGPELSEPERQQIAEIVGIGSIKYADLHHNRESDYVFDWDKMISMTGDTAAYMQYVYARVCGIFRKAGIERSEVTAASGALQLTHPAERALGLQLARLEETLHHAASEYRPNLITTYLFETANTFSTFYDQCPVAAEENEALRWSRLKMCDLTATSIQLGLSLLGIAVSERL